ncbi:MULTISPECIES: adaptor protein MecA [unclassified Bacillus (in: firmicutes)]|uniref:adaptor protein MecA n=1 Tax=unclassified Bacillus (in: firmicutes) TaxID=185979 RepID=UPI000BF3D977|nr:MULTISPECIES: adaptor protein MecA [unclassified Bacillus (in: firmicutes)]PFH87837.1 adaptor protein MecA [Bacillus sp. AFS088145]PGM59874.1 adaptor protein MecA [Bacillus sp. AFS053548]
MEIERINENTFKFSISYLDIEERGFSKDEVWLDRERSEELFWELIDEAHLTEEFIAGGPLWIQVQALDKGLEVVVTKAVISKDGKKVEVNLGEGEKNLEIPFISVDDDDDSDEDDDDDIFEAMDEEETELILSFKNFEDIISLSHAVNQESFETTLYSFQDYYYLYVKFEEELLDEVQVDYLSSMLLEYGHRSKVTIHVLEEYGKLIYEKTALPHFKSIFPLL